MRWILFLFLLGCAPGDRYFLQEDNDFFSPRGNHDQNFTQGIRIGKERATEEGRETYYGQHLFYTPADKQSKNPGADQRRYAGYLAGGYKISMFDGVTYTVEAGLVGPHAYGKEVQRTFHKWLGQGYPNGWDTQISDRPTLLTSIEKRVEHSRWRYADLYTVTGASAGNLINQAYVAGTIRVGTGLGLPFDPIFPRISLSDSSFLSCHLFATVLSRAVAYNLFLAGKELPYVAEGRLGVKFVVGPVDLSYTYIKQTREYEAEDHGMRFGEVTMGLTW